MSALSRYGAMAARTALFQHQRYMASASVNSDPVQKLFLDKIKEFKSANKGLDSTHEKAMKEEMNRLKRVYSVEDENKLAQFDYKFSNEHQVSLHDLDETRELRAKIASGEYQKQLSTQTAKQSDLIATTPEQVTLDLHLPPLNKPDPLYMLENTGHLQPMKIDGSNPDYEFIGDKMTPERLQRDMRVRFGPDMPTINDDKSPQRDLVNFPHIPLNEYTPPTRYHFIPESWFQFFYPKTGVTGPYAFAGAFSTLLFSKEWIVWEHEILTGFTSTIIITYAVIKYGPKISAYLRDQVIAESNGWENWRTGNIKTLSEMQTHYKNELQKAELCEQLYNIRRQDVEVQLECEHRNRLKTVYNDTRRRLNYLVAVADSQRQIAFKNMVNWVIQNAVASIGQKQENEVLDNCISNLKQLASKNANAV